MKQDIFFNIDQTVVIGGCSIAVVIFTSFIHHLVGKITGWWSPKWGSLVFSIIIGGIVQFQYVEVLEPIHIIIIIGNIVLIFLTAVGINALVGKPIEIITDIGTEDTRSINGKVSFWAMKENWQTRWFE